MKKLLAIALLLLAISPVHAGIIFGPLTSGSSQTPPPSGTAPVVTSLACTVALPVTNATNVNLVGGGSCAYTATCNSTACTGMNAITGWAITTQSTANSFSITNAGILQGGSSAGSVTTGSYTVTVTATNTTGTSPGVVQSISTFQPPVVASLACSIKSPITNNTNVTLQAGGNCQYTATCGGGACSGANAISGWSVVADTCTSCYQVTSSGILQGSTNAGVVTNQTDTVTVVATNAGGNSPSVAQTVTAVTVPHITNQNFSVNLPLTPGGGQTIGTMAAAPTPTSWAITAVTSVPLSCQRGSAFADGCSGASVGSAQFPTLLNSYASRAPWNVAGVDYPVGVPTGTTLANPSTISVSGMSCNGTTHVCTASGASDITIGNCGAGTGIDFSANNGWQVVTSSFTGTLTIECSNFAIGSNNLMAINATAPGSSVVLLKDSFDGGGAQGHNSSDLKVMQSFNTVNMTVEYCYFTNAFSDFIDFTYTDPSGTQNIVVKWNLFYDFGVSPSHANPLQSWGVSTTSYQIVFNTVYNPAPTAGFPSIATDSFIRVSDIQLSEGVGRDCGATNSCVVNGLSISNNTLLMLGLGWSNIIAAGGTGSDPINEVPNLIISNNYIDPTKFGNAAFGPLFGQFSHNPNPRVFNNINMLGAAPLLIIMNQFNGYNNSPPSRPPIVTNITNTIDVINANGTCDTDHGDDPAGSLTVYDGNTSISTTTCNTTVGTFSWTSGTLSSGAHLITFSDVYGNSSTPQSITLP